ncbi:unnamed protein product [Adineta ricciae]|uniref:Uncharacterized protein n=1 Tax=Adineta ricciae TaxID=249248 RepID=A0A815R338_ADIRI|nr:unnamed protein product [Adineta ricciae]
MLTYSNRNVNTFLQVNHLRRFFVNVGHAQNDYTKITTIDDYWLWLENSFLKNIRAHKWCNNNKVSTDLRGFTNDTSNRLVGWVTITQLRVTSAIRNAFVYTKGKQPGTYLYMGTQATYDSGGYVYEIRGRPCTIHHL